MQVNILQIFIHFLINLLKFIIVFWLSIFKLNVLIDKSRAMFDSVTSIISSHLYTSQAIQVKTKSIQADYIKNNVSALNNLHNVQDCQINIPSFCDLLNSDSCSSGIITQKVRIHPHWFFKKSKKKYSLC